MFYIILGTLVFLAVITLIILVFKNKIQEVLLRIDEVENSTDILLKKKLDLVSKTCNVFKEKSEDGECLSTLESIKHSDMNHFESNDYLKNCYIDILKIIDDNDKFTKDQNLLNIINDLNDNEEDLIASLKFYNDNVTVYNKIISSFPANIIRIFMRLKRKEFYSTEKKEIFEILKK